MISTSRHQRRTKHHDREHHLHHCSQAAFRNGSGVVVLGTRDHLGAVLFPRCTAKGSHFGGGSRPRFSPKAFVVPRIIRCAGAIPRRRDGGLHGLSAGPQRSTAVPPRRARGLPPDSLWPHGELRRTRRQGWQSEGCPRRRFGDAAQPDLHHHPVPPRPAIRRRRRRILSAGGSGAQGAAFGDGAKRKIKPTFPPKFETRISKTETNTKSEIQNLPCRQSLFRVWVFRASKLFRVSCFEIRIWRNFGGMGLPKTKLDRPTARTLPTPRPVPIHTAPCTVSFAVSGRHPRIVH